MVDNPTKIYVVDVVDNGYRHQFIMSSDKFYSTDFKDCWDVQWSPIDKSEVKQYAKDLLLESPNTSRRRSTFWLWLTRYMDDETANDVADEIDWLI